MAGFQSFFRVLTQMSPEGCATFGWKIFVRKKPFGGLAGKLSWSTILHLKTPPWYGVPTKSFVRLVVGKATYLDP